MEATTVYRDYVGIMEKKRETTISGLGFRIRVLRFFLQRSSDLSCFVRFLRVIPVPCGAACQVGRHLISPYGDAAHRSSYACYYWVC